MFSEALRRLRKKAKLNQSELAAVLNVSQSTVAGWENGARKPDLDTVEKIATFFNVTVDDLLDRSKPAVQDEAMQIRERLRTDPNYRLLFSAAENASPEHLKAAAAMLKALEPDYDD